MYSEFSCGKGTENSGWEDGNLNQDVPCISSQALSTSTICKTKETTQTSEDPCENGKTKKYFVNCEA